MISIIIPVVVGVLTGMFVFLLMRVRIAQGLATRDEKIIGLETLLNQKQSDLADARTRLAMLDGELSAAREAHSGARAEIARLEAEIKAEKAFGTERVNTLQQHEERLKDTFKAIASDTLQQTMKSQKESVATELDARKSAIENLVKPIQDQLAINQKLVHDLDLSRKGDYAGLKVEIEALQKATGESLKAASELSGALKHSGVKGNWGQFQLKRVVELSGMSEHIVFEEQTNLESEGGRLRPDMIIRMPNGRVIPVDAKVSIDAFFNASRALNEKAAQELLSQHAKATRSRVDELARKAYQDNLGEEGESLDFVVMFVPGDSFLIAAFAKDPELLDHALSKKVMITSPTTLLALLKAVGYGWKENRLTESAHLIETEGRELYERLCKAAEYLTKLGASLNNTVDKYNEFVSSLESRFLPQARKFSQLGINSTKTLPDNITDIDVIAKKPSAPELSAPGDLPGREEVQHSSGKK